MIYGEKLYLCTLLQNSLKCFQQTLMEVAQAPALLTQVASCAYFKSTNTIEIQKILLSACSRFPGIFILKVGFFIHIPTESMFQDQGFNLRSYSTQKFFLHPLLYTSMFQKLPEPKVGEDFHVCLWLENLVCETLVPFCYFSLHFLFNEQNKNPSRHLAELLNLFQITTFFFLFSASFCLKDIRTR